MWNVYIMYEYIMLLNFMKISLTFVIFFSFAIREHTFYHTCSQRHFTFILTFTIVIYDYIKFLRAYSRTRTIFSLRRVTFRFYNFCSCWITRPRGETFFLPLPRDCEIIRRASRASVSDFRASQRERALSLFTHISSSRVCAYAPRYIAWVCTQRARLYRRVVARC